MLNKLLSMIRTYAMLNPGDTLYCAVSGGADSVALLWGMYLLREKLGIDLRAAHFNHHLRGAESDRDEGFVRSLCDRWNIPLVADGAEVAAGKKGLEAAAREARYSFLEALPGKVATAHTADDNAETVLMRLVRGTGLKGLGGICPVRGNVIRPMLMVTRQEVLAFLECEHLPYVEDSSNQSDCFLRNRLRHHVLPLLCQENPKLGENLSAMALRLREDAQALEPDGTMGNVLSVFKMKTLPKAKRSRWIAAFLKQNGVPEPESSHIFLTERLLFSDCPSAKAVLPGGVILHRRYDMLLAASEEQAIVKQPIICPGITDVPEAGLRIVCTVTDKTVDCPEAFSVAPHGTLFLRQRAQGDALKRHGGTKSLKKWMIDRKIPADLRPQIPVICDEAGIVGVYGIGKNLARLEKACVLIRFEKLCNSSQ